MPTKSNPTVASSARQRRDGSDCLETSLQLLHSSVEHAKAWDESCRETGSFACHKASGLKSATTTPTTAASSSANSTSSAWWVNLLQRLQESHRTDRQQWEHDLKKAKNQSSHFKEELKETIEDRIAWLEERFLEEIQNQSNRGGDNHSGDSTVSTTHADTSDSDADYNQLDGQARMRRNKSLLQSLAPPALDANVEVSYDSAMALQRLDELERVVERQQAEKSELSTLLEHATRVTHQGEQLSASMQQQLQTLLKEVDQTAQKQKRYYREKVATQKRLLQLLEQQHNNTVDEFRNEKSLLEATIEQLRSEKAALEKSLEAVRIDHEAQREGWEREKRSLQSVIRHLEGDDRDGLTPGRSQEGAFIISSNSDDCYQDDVSSIHASTFMVRPASSASVSSPRRAAGGATEEQWDEHYDRALVERDYFRQEAEHAKRELQSLKSMTSNGTGDASVASDAGFIKELEKEVERYKRQLDKELDHYRNLAAYTQKEFDEYRRDAHKELSVAKQQLQDADEAYEKKLASAISEYQRLLNEKEDEMQAAIAELMNQHEGLSEEQRYRDSLEKRNGLASKIRKLERQRDDEKCEWKLRLETVVAEKNRFQEESERLSKILDELSVKHKSELTELEKKLGQESLKWTECTSGAESTNKRLSKELKESKSKLEKLKRERDNWEDLMERHSREAEEWASQLQEVKESYSAEVARLNESLAEARLACDESIAKLTESEAEVAGLKAELQASKSETDVTKSNKAKHLEEMQTMAREVEKSKGETRALVDKTNELTRSLESLRRDHSVSKSKWESLIVDKDNQILELRVQCCSLTEKLDGMASSTMDSKNFMNSMEELRKDVVSIRDTLESTAVTDKTIAGANHAQLSDDIGAVQTTLNEALAEITLGSEAMMEMRDIIDKVLKAVKSRPDSNRESQHQLLSSEILELRELASTLAETHKSGVSLLSDSMRQEMVADLQKKESRIAELNACFEQTKAELSAVREKLSSAEHEIATLNDQADAYGEELMRIQALNAGLEDALSAAERKMEEAILQQGHQPYGDRSVEYGKIAAGAEDSTPLLEEALALAQGLTDLVHGRDEDTDVMDMLQSLSDLMDQHERGEWHPSERSDADNENREGPPSRPRPGIVSHQFPGVPRPRTRSSDSSTASAHVNVSGKREGPPAPVQTPEASRHDTSLQIVVEQLYARCQLLERERTQMIETTLDLLSAAREANEAELDAALITARRRATEEVLRVRKESHKEKERLYLKVCGACAKGLLIAGTSPVRSEGRAPIVSTADGAQGSVCNV